MKNYQKLSAFFLVVCLLCQSLSLRLKTSNMNQLFSNSKLRTKQTPNDWTYCSGESQTCSFSGTKIVAYGAEGKFKFKEGTSSIACNNSTFGDPISGTVKACYYKNIPYSWIQCASENGRCSFTGYSLVKYGANEKYNYKTSTDGIDCKNGEFGDPISGVAKTCYYLTENDWTFCANENGTCSFSGTRLIMYGANGYAYYTEATGSVGCKNSVFGDPIKGTAKTCEYKISEYYWVECAKENATCEIPGTAVVRYGNNGKYVYRRKSGSINCNNDLFGDPLPGVGKICEFASYISDGLATPLQSLTSSVASESVTEDAALAYSTCSDSAGFGFTGQCLSQLFGSNNGGAPSSTVETIGFLYQILYRIGYSFDLCLGDFTGDQLANSSNLSYNGCDSLALMEDFKYGTIAANVANVPCGATPQSIAFCVAFDRCGSVALSVNAGIAQCAATYSTGIAAILSPLSDTLDYLTFGFSVKRRFTLDFTISYRSGSSVVTKEISTYGHFMVGLGLSFPMKNFKIGGIELEDLFSLNISSTFIIDFGNTTSTISSLVSQIKSASTSTGKTIVETLLNTNVEMALTIEGTFSINFNDLSKGMFPNLEINIGNGNILISNGGGSSGMNRGIYMYFSTNMILNRLAIFNIIVDRFSPILDLFGIPKPTLPSDTAIGVFIQDDAFGIYLKGLGLELKCMFIYSGYKASCDFNHKFFTIIMDGINWVVKFATKFFDDTGKEVVKFSNDVAKFATNAANATSNFFKNDARNFFERDFTNAFSTAGNAVGDFFVKDVGGAFENVGNDIKDFFKGW